MAAVSAWLIDKVSLLLDQNEREVVEGDLVERGEGGVRALASILGLVVRRQAALFADWRPWIVVLLVVVPLGMVLSLIARLWSDATSVDVWLYQGHWDWNFLQYPGLRSDLLRVVFLTLRDYVALICWSWTCGFAIASISRRTAVTNLLLFWLVLLMATLGSSTTMRNNQVFTSVVATTIAPLIVKILAVAIPVALGMRRALTAERIALKTALLWTFAIVTITVANHASVETAGSFFGWRPFGVSSFCGDVASSSHAGHHHLAAFHDKSKILKS